MLPLKISAVSLRRHSGSEKGSGPQLLQVEGAGTVPKVLMFGADPLVRDDLLILLRTMGEFAPRLRSLSRNDDHIDRNAQNVTALEAR